MRAHLSHMPVKDKAVAIDNASANFRFATAVASFGMLLRNSQYKGNASYTVTCVHSPQKQKEDDSGRIQKRIP
jgi:Ca-activated chloride channel family protein